MTNKRRDKGGYNKRLKRYNVSRKSILVIEKILWEYADAREMLAAGQTALPKGRKHMPRKVIDRHININGERFDSIKFIPKDYTKTRYLEILCRPGIKVTFTPFATEVYAQTNYATGSELNTMKKVVASLEKYIENMPKSLLNNCYLSK